MLKEQWCVNGASCSTPRRQDDRGRSRGNVSRKGKVHGHTTVKTGNTKSPGEAHVETKSQKKPAFDDHRESETYHTVKIN